MQLSSRILTALAVLILAVAVVAVRGGSSGTVEAATGTIDVLNVGTCYTTNSDVFAVGNCNDGDGTYNVTGRDSISEVGTVYATYSHDPKTAADDPRGILTNSDLIKVSIQDTGRDKRTPVVLPVDGADSELSAAEFAKITAVFKNIGTRPDDDRAADTTVTPNIDAIDNGPRIIGGSAVPANIVTTREDASGTIASYHLAGNVMRWDDDAIAANGLGALDPGVENGLRVIVAEDTGTTPTTPQPDYLPMDAGDNAVIRFFGYLCTNDTTTPDANDACDDTAGGDVKSAFMDLSGTSLVLDEDRGSGRAEGDVADASAVAPWLNVQVNKPSNGVVVLQYIVYNTSERETLVGGKKSGDYGSEADQVDESAPDFTTSETDGDSALSVKIKSDGDASEQNLWLYETGRFTGRYEGYARLTDADGDGPDVAGGDPFSNWGLQVKSATGSSASDEEVAVIGVESGPVTIEYRDTDGHVQTKSIMIDTVPPAIQIDTPAHKSEDQDTSPEFAGSFSDSDSGLRETSFQLYVDNSNDDNESGGDDSNNNLALDLRVNDSTNPVYGYVAMPATGEVVRAIENYQGYSADDRQFGVIEHTHLYGMDTTSSGIRDGLAFNNDALLNVRGDRYSDGATNGTFADSVRIRINETTADDAPEVNPYNNTIDFHALVADRAGNIGFSDSDEAGPRLINDYGTEDDDRKTGMYNVLGWYARHIFFLDEKDPEVYREQSVTGFYGINDDKEPVVNRSGILIAFDAAVDADTINLGTFEVMNGDASATVTGVTVEGRQVYLLLAEELASDATPSVNIAAGQAISDPAGNRLTRGGLATAVAVNDGIAPKFTVTLSGGSGTGEGNEASDKLTNKAMTITVASDEEINSTPSITVVCSNIGWDSDDADSENDKGLSDFTGDRSGPLSNSSANFSVPASYMCGDDATVIRPQQVQSFSRPGLEWEYQWQNFSGDKALSDGKLTVVAYGRDRKSYASLQKRSTPTTPAASDTHSWGVATAEFNFDITEPELTATPGDGATVTDARPFLLLNYDDKSTVSVSKLTVDGTEQTEQVQTLGAKRFLYWPESLALGSHDVAVEAVDAAGNKTGSDEYSFKVAERATFDVKLIAGWNAVSLPANPIDPSVGSVFTEPIVDMIAAWDGENPEAPWSIATRMEGEWSTHSNFATLNRITARYGYWVHAQGFVTQSVALVGKGNREDPTTVPADLVEIPTNPGWNFVGVVDQDGDQTQDHYGQPLKNGDTEISASGYLGDHVRAYTWDAIRNRFDILEGGETVTIGEGIWVYYGGGIAP